MFRQYVSLQSSEKMWPETATDHWPLTTDQWPMSICRHLRALRLHERSDLGVWRGQLSQVLHLREGGRRRGHVVLAQVARALRPVVLEPGATHVCPGTADGLRRRSGRRVEWPVHHHWWVTAGNVIFTLIISWIVSINNIKHKAAMQSNFERRLWIQSTRPSCIKSTECVLIK